MNTGLFCPSRQIRAIALGKKKEEEGVIKGDSGVVNGGDGSSVCEKGVC